MADISRVSATWAWRPLQMVSNKNKSLSYRLKSQLVRARYVITIQKKLGTMTLLLQSEIQFDALNWFGSRWRPVPKRQRRKEENYFAYAFTSYDNHTLVLTPGEKNCSGDGGSVLVDRYLGNSVQTIQKAIWPIRRLCYSFCRVTQVSSHHNNYKTVVDMMTWFATDAP